MVGFDYEVVAVAQFHYELKRPAAMQTDWSTLLSCGPAKSHCGNALHNSSCMIPSGLSDYPNKLR